jgi:tetratricopeptide (TPR) repeat protein
MLPETILYRWREASAIKERLNAFSQEEVAAAQAFFQKLQVLDSSEVRAGLSNADERLNRNLAWLLFDKAAEIDINNAVEDVQRLLEWAEFIAGFGGALQNLSDNPEAHCKFYRGVLRHTVGARSEAALLYAQAEIDYRDQSSTVLQSLAVCARGVAELEQGHAEDVTPSHPGARGLFQSALDVLDEATHKKLKDELREVAGRLLQQWQLAGQLISSNQPEPLLADNRQMIDLQLLTLLEAQTMNLVFDNQPVTTTARAARLTDRIAAQLQRPARVFEKLLEFYWWRKDLDAAEWLIGDQLKMRPGDLELQKTLARALILHSKNREALELLKEIAQVHPDDALVQSMIGSVLYTQGAPAEAESHFRRALELDPEEAGAQYGLRAIANEKPAAEVHFKDGTLTLSGDIENAEPGEFASAMTAAILAANPESAAARLEEIAQSDPQLARKVTRLLRQKGVLEPAGEPASVQHYRRAEQFFGEGRFQEAVREYSLTVEADPDFAEAYMGWGDVYYRTGLYQLAIAYFEESIIIKPMPPTYRFLGDSYVRIGKRKQAEEAYRQALNLDPNYGGARVSLQRLLKMEG